MVSMALSALTKTCSAVGGAASAQVPSATTIGSRPRPHAVSS